MDEETQNTQFESTETISEPEVSRKEVLVEESTPEIVGIYAIRTTANKERNVAAKMIDRIQKKGYKILSFLIPGIKGYLFVEGTHSDIDKAYRGVAHARGMVAGQTNIKELEHFLAPTPVAMTLQEGFIVEVTSGPFKGEKAKINRIDEAKNECTIELLEATVPIPITVPAESVRILETNADVFTKETKPKDIKDEDDEE